MIALGIDLSSMPGGTAACLINWQKTRVVSRAPELGCDDKKLDELIGEAAVVGVDAPFGWPKAFVDAVASWKTTVWSKDERKRLQFRSTDLYVRHQLQIWPLSVSTDRIALPAMRANALLNRHGVKDRSGGGSVKKAPTGRRTPRFFEVYPAASLKRWGLPYRGYKLIDPGCTRLRRQILRGIRKHLPWLEVDDQYAENSDALDALIASLTARAAAQGLSEGPELGLVAAARREGWIHLPTDWPKL